ncbi:MAG TPA: PDZ domain-containing protein, partial [Candidatus Saccharimonadales bacterium]
NNGAFIAPSSDPTVSPVIAGSPAAKAGLQVNDIITQVNGTNIDRNHSLTSLIDQHSVGDKLDLTVARGSKTIHVTVTLGAEPNDDQS